MTSAIEPLRLDWKGKLWCQLRATDGRWIDVVFWNHWRVGRPPTPGITLDTEVRFRGLARVKNGEGKGGRRARWKLAVVREGFTMTKIRLYALPLGSLLACPGPLVLKPTAQRYAKSAATIPASELERLAVAMDHAAEAGDWIMSGTPRPPPDAARQLEAF